MAVCPNADAIDSTKRPEKSHFREPKSVCKSLQYIENGLREKLILGHIIIILSEFV
jgi:hypothetical protein